MKTESKILAAAAVAAGVLLLKAKNLGVTGVGGRLSSFDDFDISYIKKDNRSIKEWALDAYNNFDTVRNVFQEKYGQMFINKLNPNEKRLWDAVSQEWANAAILKARNKAW